jgi:hypothetical protein
MEASGAYPGWQVALSFFLGWLFVILGLLGLLALPVIAWRTHQFVVEAVHARAPIVDFKTYPSERGHSPTYRPIVAIADPSGASARVEVGSPAFPNPRHVGDRVAVLYPEGRPAEAVADTTEDVWGAVVAAAVVAPFLLFLGVGIVVWMRYFVRHPPDHLLWLDKWGAPLKLIVRLGLG